MSYLVYMCLIDEFVILTILKNLFVTGKHVTDVSFGCPGRVL